ncbi:MAG TPA: 4a-hydroxytetrahydrobiopterin dehydratase [Terracidiphilus sp.]|jgi:4a-hydroxytetrahydrobiopterin dehydratase
MKASPLMESDIAARLAAVPRWNQKGAEIVRTFEFRDFPAALAFVNQVGDLAENAGHHPDIDIRWNKVRLALTTHDAGGLTTNDFDLAAKIDRVEAS